MRLFNWLKHKEKTHRGKNEALLSAVSQYIEAHYEGYSYRNAYHFDEAKELPNATQSEPQIRYSISPVFPIEGSDDLEADVFDDILKIFNEHEEEDPATRSVEQLDRIKDLLEERGHVETFSEQMLRIISEKKLEETEVYHRVFMDRKLFNKIRNDPNYQPSKRTALLIAIALKLTVPEAQNLLAKAGFALTHCSKTDLIVECCILQDVYDIFEINDMLNAFGLPLLAKFE